MHVYKHYLNTLQRFSQRRSSVSYRLASLAAGALFFLAILPSLFFFVGRYIENQIPVDWPRTLELIIGFIALFPGVFFLLWTTVVPVYS